MIMEAGLLVGIVGRVGLRVVVVIITVDVESVPKVSLLPLVLS